MMPQYVSLVLASPLMSVSFPPGGKDARDKSDLRADAVVPEQ